MQQNIGKWDRGVRLAIGVVLVITAVIQKSAGSMLMGLFTLYEALAGWCVFYQLIGRNTCPLGQRKGLGIGEKWLGGAKILLVAIILNVVAGLVGLTTWYGFLQNPSANLSLDNYIFLFVAYPFVLGWVAKS